MIVDKAKAIEVLEEVVAYRGDKFKYKTHNVETGPECRYEYRGEPDCGIGVALSKLGVPVEDLASFDELFINTFGGMVMMEKLKERDIRFTHLAERIFQRFQELQDMETPYNEALSVVVDEVRYNFTEEDIL